MTHTSLRPAGSYRILIAEDEPHIRRILITLLEASGLQVDVAEDGTQALECLRGGTLYHLVITDLMMPGASGLEVVETLRSGPRSRIPIVVLTAKGQDTDRDRAFQLGADDFITKPFSPKKLLTRIDELLSRT
jgi:DNA-binding response OmpR family regulator